MFDDLLPYYNNELRFMRDLAKEFAAAHPKIAGRLRVSQDTVEDPHVSRMIEAFAFLNARVRMKLDDEFPELTESLLGLLYPHYLSPIPSMGIVEFTPQSSLSGQKTIAAGATITTEPVDGEACEYRTGYDVELWPIKLTNLSLTGLPLVAPTNRKATAALCSLRLSLACTTSGKTFSKLGLDRLRFYINSESRTAQILYELVTGGVLSIALADSAVDEAPVILDRASIRPVGLTRDEVLLPLAAGSEPGYAMLSEYFAFPEKFLFFDIENLSAKTLLNAGRTMEIFLYLDRYDPALEGLITSSDIRLFCTPMINLFPAKADPIRLDPGRFEYRVAPDARRESSLEVYSVDRVVVSDRAGQEQPFSPFFSFGGRQIDREAVGRFWHTTRRGSPYSGGGDDVFLSVVDDAGEPAGDRDLVASVDITATNRNLPENLPFGGGRPVLSLRHEVGVEGCRCLIAPTRPLRSRRGHGSLWRLISHLSLNHLSVAEGALATDLVKELLALYDHVDASGSRAIIERLSDVRTAPSIARSPDAGRIAFTSGTDITLEFDDTRLSGSGAFMLGAVLETVFAGLSAINAFTRVRLQLKGEKGAWQTWRARTGTRRLI